MPAHDLLAAVPLCPLGSEVPGRHDPARAEGEDGVLTDPSTRKLSESLAPARHVPQTRDGGLRLATSWACDRAVVTARQDGLRVVNWESFGPDACLEAAERSKCPRMDRYKS
jgi:hypothetical protein